MAEGGGNASKHDCSICLTIFKAPKMLPCFHSFCLQCLEEYVIRNGKDGTFECPLCRVCTDIPVGGVKSFQFNFYILEGNSLNENINCDMCGEGHDATHYCTGCEDNFCDRCTTYHMKMKVPREHTLLNLKALSDKDGNYTRRIQKKYFCLQHKGEEIKMVCKDCDIKLCVVCKLTEHENHNTSSITKEAEETRALLVNTIARTRKHIESLKRKDIIANNLATAMEKELDTNIALLDKQVESVIAKVKKDAGVIKQELIESITKAKDHYLEKGKLVKGKIMESEAVINHAQNIVELGDDSQVLDKKLVSKLQSVSLTEECFIKHPEHLIFEASGYGTECGIIGKTSKVSSHLTVRQLDEIKPSWSVSTQANAMSIVEAGILYAAFTDFSSFLHHKTDESESDFTEDFYKKGTCAGLTSIVNVMYFTSVANKTVYKLKTPRHVKAKFLSFKDHPHGIANRSCGNKENERELLICCLKSGNLLDMNASEGCVIAVSVADKKQYTWREKEMPGPTCIATNALDGTVCLGYPAAHKVTLNASDGTVLSVFSGEGWRGIPEIYCPVSVCFDNQCGIIIADYKNRAVIRIDEFGNFLQCLLQVHVTTPLSVLSGDNNTLYVGFIDENITRYQLKPDK